MKTVAHALSLVVVIMGLLPAGPAVAAAPTAEMILVTGEVRVNGSVARIGQVLVSGDRIQTGSDSLCEKSKDGAGASEAGAVENNYEEQYDETHCYCGGNSDLRDAVAAGCVCAGRQYQGA